MAKKENPSSKELDEAKAAKQKLKAAEKAKASDGKKDKDEKAPKQKKARRFWKDFRGELKKIVWPDFKTVLKNTGIVLLTTVIIGVPVWILDYALSEGVLGLKNMAQATKAETTTAGLNLNLEDLLAQMTTAAGDVTQPAAEPTTEPAVELATEPVTEPVTEPTTEPAAEAEQ